MDKKDTIFISADGDGIGRLVGRAVLSDDPEKLNKVSERIEKAQIIAKAWIKENGGIKIAGGGDEFVASIPKDAEHKIEKLRKDIEYACGYTISVGIGDKLAESGQALLLSKLHGKNKITKYNKESKKEIEKIKKRVKKGKFKNMEEYKIGEQYLNKTEEELSCPYCEQTDGIDTAHCKWCHDIETKENEEKCPFCQNDPSLGPKEPEIAEEDCPFCKEKSTEEQSECPYCNEKPEALVSADSNNEMAPAGSKEEKDQYDRMGMSPPEIGKPQPGDELPIGQNPPMDVVPKDNDAELESSQPSGVSDPRLNVPEIDPEDNHSKEALISIAQQIEDDGTPTESQADSVGAEDMSSGTEMEGNTSRPEGYEQNTPGDLGTGGPNVIHDDGPDFYNILEEGLDQNADGIRKEKAVKMVSQALMQFKSCKDILEQSKLQTPQLYQASISMLKAMIEMANMLGLGQSGSEASLGPINAQAESTLGQVQDSLTPEVPEQENEWQEPFPAHPDHGGEKKPGHSPPSKPKEEGNPSPQQ